MRQFAVWLLSASALLCAVEPRKSAADYPARAESNVASLGAEFIGRFVMQDGASHNTGDYIAIEIGYYPKQDAPAEVRGSDFLLRINGAKQLIYPQSAGLVAGAVLHPEWENHRGLVAGGSMGGADVILGGPRRTSRFPGDPTVRTPGRIPSEPDRQGGREVEKDPLEAAAAAIKREAFPEGLLPGARAGYVYFIHKKKLTNLKKLELVWTTGGGKRSLTLK